MFNNIIKHKKKKRDSGLCNYNKKYTVPVTAVHQVA